MDKAVTETGQKLKNYCSQKNTVYIDNTNINEHCLGVENIHLNRKGNNCFAKKILKYLNII